MTRQQHLKPSRARARRWFERRGHDRREPTAEFGAKSPRPSNGLRATLLLLVVVLDALAFATLLRPRHGYTSTHRLLLVLALGVGAAVGALLLAGAALAFRRRRDRSLWSATTALPTISFVLAAFIATAGTSQIVRAIRPAAGSEASAAVARADFQRWQATVVPIVVTWMDTIREDSAFAHGLPSTPGTALRRRVDRSEQTFVRLARTLAADSPRLPQRLDLRRLTNQLETALVVARRAQQTYALALAAATPGSVARRNDRARIQRLIASGNAEAQRSLAIMAAFSFDANKLGGSLFVEPLSARRNLTTARCCFQTEVRDGRQLPGTFGLADDSREPAHKRCLALLADQPRGDLAAVID